MLNQITPVILTRDEEPNIARTLAQLRWACEVLLVDSHSTDGTLAIAKTFPNVRVISHQFTDFASQWLYSLQFVRSPWILALDADYFVTDELIAELRALSLPPLVRGARVSFTYAVQGRPLRASLYPARIVLAATDAVSFRQDGHAHRIEVNGETAVLSSRIIHDDRKSFRSFLERQRRYMKQEAVKVRGTAFRGLPLSGRVRKLIVIAPAAVLAHTLVAQGLILDGRAGLRYAWERFVAEIMLSRELLRFRHDDLNA